MKLKPFEITQRKGARAMLKCPRRDCGQEFTVAIGVFREGPCVNPIVKTRPCPYCFRISLIPAKLRRRKK